MSPIEIATVAVALVTAIGAATVNIIVALRTERKLDANTADTAVILGHVNSKATLDAARIASQNQEILQLRQLLVESEVRARLLAQATALGAKKSGTPKRP